MQNGGSLLPEDIHPHWFIRRSDNSVYPQAALPATSMVLEPLRLRGKGRPKGALGGVSRVPKSSTRRNPSAFELPSSSAPPVLASNSRQFQQSTPSMTTSLALARMEAVGRDTYEPGTMRERACLRAISSIWNTDHIEGDTMEVIEQAMELGTEDDNTSSDEVPEIILGETETQWERMQNGLD